MPPLRMPRCDVFCFFQVFSGRVHEAVRGHVGQFQAETLNSHNLLSAYAGSTTGLPVREEIHQDVLADSLKAFSKTVQASNINGRNLQESSCADGTSSISVTSTVFPLMEGCLEPGLVEGDVFYSSGTAIIGPLEASSSTDVSILLELNFSIECCRWTYRQRCTSIYLKFVGGFPASEKK